MSEELEVLLDHLQNIVETIDIRPGSDNFTNINDSDIKLLLDYITNLQNIIKEVREYIENTTYADITGLEKHSIKEFWFVKELLEILDKEK